MTPKLEHDLVTRYPEIFKDHGGDPQKTCMAWGIDVGDGWFDILDVLCASLVGPLRQADMRLRYLLESVCGTKESNVTQKQILEQEEEIKLQRDLVPVALQVKEKFGGLRFYVTGATPEKYAVIAFAEDISYRVCEDCGAPGKTYPWGWVRTLCPAHALAIHGEKALTPPNEACQD